LRLEQVMLFFIFLPEVLRRQTECGRDMFFRKGCLKIWNVNDRVAPDFPDSWTSSGINPDRGTEADYTTQVWRVNPATKLRLLVARIDSRATGNLLSSSRD
jgi:hypothetical protein